MLLGCIFKASMLMYKIAKCDCCGIMKPRHCDTEFPKDAIMKRNMFFTKMHDAIHCNCAGFCKGSQFYSKEKTSEMEYYVQQHDGKYPFQVIPSLNRPNDSNSLICHDCYCEITHENVEGMLTLLSFIYCSVFLFIF